MTRHAVLSPLALNFAAPGAVPDWVQLTPPGPRLSGRDGRQWVMPRPDAVAAAFQRMVADGAAVPVDFEHATEIRGPKGEPAPAVGWLTEVDVRDGALWGRVDWTDEGRAALASRAYRFLSPAFHFAPDTGEVLRLVSVGLTNRPNFRLPALNHEETPMDRDVLIALGLAPDATSAQAVAAVNQLRAEAQTALNRAANPDPALFVPRADHELALNRIAAFEAGEKTRREAEIASAVDAAIAAGKVAPASRDYHLASCRAEGGLDRFRAMVAAAPVIVGPATPKPSDPGTTAPQLSPEELAVCRQIGLTPEEFAAAKAGKE